MTLSILSLITTYRHCARPFFAANTLQVIVQNTRFKLLLCVVCQCFLVAGSATITDRINTMAFLIASLATGIALGDVGLVDHPFAADSVMFLDGEWQVRVS
jgi:hypothetical protein